MRASGAGLAELRRMAAYALSGFAATGTHYVVMVTLVSAFAVDEVLASSIGFVAGAFVKYPLNYWAVFRSRQRHDVAVVRFVAGIALAFVMNGALLALLLQVLPVHYMVSQVLTTGAVLVVNYLVARHWVFAAPRAR